MRKPRDLDAEMKALDERARQLKARKVQQLGELVIACKADQLPVEQLAGALLAAVDAETLVREGWRKRGAAFFQGKAPSPGGSAGSAAPRDPKDDGGAQPAAAADRAG